MGKRLLGRDGQKGSGWEGVGFQLLCGQRSLQAAGEAPGEADWGPAVKGLCPGLQGWHFLLTNKEPSVTFK